MRGQAILVPVNGYPCDAKALEWACSLANQVKGRVYMLYVIKMRRADPVDGDVSLDRVDQGESILRHLEEQAREYDCHVEGDVVQARNVGPAVVDEAVKRQADTIVLATPYKRQFGGFSLGKTIPYILQHAPCWVVLFREPRPIPAELST